MSESAPGVGRGEGGGKGLMPNRLCQKKVPLRANSLASARWPNGGIRLVILALAGVGLLTMDHWEARLA